MTIVFAGIDLAKNVFALHGVGDAGKARLVRPRVRRDQLAGTVAKLPLCTIGMEACSGVHRWARQFMAFGRAVRQMAPKLVVSCRLGGKRGMNDKADAADTCEAVQRPNMRFLTVQTDLPQARLAVHTVGQGLVAGCTATINRLRGVLSESGQVKPQKGKTVRLEAAARAEGLPQWSGRLALGSQFDFGVALAVASHAKRLVLPRTSRKPTPSNTGLAIDDLPLRRAREANEVLKERLEHY